MRTEHSYQTGGALKADTTVYVEREADREILQAMLDGEFCYVLTARQMGKSSLKVRTINRLKAQNWQCADVDITRFGSNDATAEQWYFNFLYETCKSFRLEDAFEDWWDTKDKFTPVGRFSAFWKEFLCANTQEELGIFIDEVDSMLSLDKEKFSTDDFFAALRAVYNEQADNIDLRRIHFCILGVAAPDDLMDDPARTPFNVGRAIQLNNLQESDAQPLLYGLERFQASAIDILRRILYWSGGQPYLTQRLCLEVSKESEIRNVEETVDRIVEEIFLSPESINEEANLTNVQRRAKVKQTHQTALLSTYGKLLRKEEVLVDLRKEEQVHLKLTGLVKVKAGKLFLNNRIYEQVFSDDWLSHIWEELNRPFSQELQTWLKTGKDKTYLLKGNTLRGAISWSRGIEDLSPEERNFLEASRTEEESKKEKQRRNLTIGIFLVAALALSTIGLAIYASSQQAQAEENERLAITAKNQTDSTLQELNALRIQLERSLDTTKAVNGQLAIANEQEKIARMDADYQRLQAEGQTEKAEALADSLDDIREALRINNLVEQMGQSNPSLSMKLADYAYQKYPSPLIQNTLLELYKREGQYISTSIGKNGALLTLTLSPNGKYILTGSSDNTARLWDISTGELVQQFLGHTDWVLAVAFHPQGKQILTGSYDNTIRAWTHIPYSLDDQLNRLNALEELLLMLPYRERIIYTPEGFTFEWPKQINIQVK